jgi:hypothetical protein
MSQTKSIEWAKGKSMEAIEAYASKDLKRKTCERAASGGLSRTKFS